MSSLSLKEKVNFIVQLCDKHDITAYEIGKNTGLNTSGVQRILNKEVKKPHNKTLNSILEFIEKKIVGIELHNNAEKTTLIKEPNSSYKPIINQSGVVPYYNIDLSGPSFANFKEASKHIEFYIDYKPLNNCTAYLPYHGDSMYPLYKSGNTLAVKLIKNHDIILWGEPHLVITNENANNYKTVKCIHQHPDATKIILRAKNPDYSGDIVINKSDIISLYIVKGKIELNKL